MANMNFGVNILPKANNTYTLGNSDYKWNIYANSINGTSLSNIITDAQIDGVSIVNNGVIDIPLAGEEVTGVVKLNTAYGLYKASGYLRILKAPDAKVKEGTGQYQTIVPYNQHLAAFYGLAKAAGDSTQAASSNSVGNYTNEAKAAIQSMLGILNIDVQINGTSILSNNVANIPVASSTLGLAKIDSFYGTNANSEGRIYLSKATDTEIKAGTQQYKPIVPYSQHEAVFYGLAKAAGDSTQASSSNAVGTYTSDAKTAIQSMLGISSSGPAAVTDIKINNTSILNNGIANIPCASNDNFGVVKLGGSFTLDSSDNKIYVNNASEAAIKNGIATTSYIPPFRQHLSVFYGLAKAAGDSTQALSSNAIGAYTDEAKAAIRNMLGIPIATSNTLGVVKGGFGTTIDANGNLNVNIDDNGSFGDYDKACSVDAMVSITNWFDMAVKNLIDDYELSDPTIMENYKIGTNGDLVANSDYNTYVFEIPTNDNPIFVIYPYPGTGYQFAQYTSSTLSAANASIVVDRTKPIQIPKYYLVTHVALSCEKGLIEEEYLYFYAMKGIGVSFNDHASTSAYGVVQVGNGLGVNSSSGKLQINSAGTGVVKEGTSAYFPIVPGHQHESVFYGLAKAAGDSTQVSSSNAVGTYTDTALGKIQDMLHIADSGIVPTIKTTTVTIDSLTDSWALTAKKGYYHVDGGNATGTFLEGVSSSYGLLEILGSRKDDSTATEYLTARYYNATGKAYFRSFYRTTSSSTLAWRTGLQEIITSAFTGATASVAGAKGLVPAPSAGDEGKFLKGDGTWNTPVVVLTYGVSTYTDFINAYNAGAMIYCRASTDTSDQTLTDYPRYAALSYVKPDLSFIEFLYYRSISNHTSTYYGDDILIYELSNTNTWSTTKRDNSLRRIGISGDGLSTSFNNNILTLTTNAFTGATSNAVGTSGMVPAPAIADTMKFLRGDGTWATVSGGGGGITGITLVSTSLIPDTNGVVTIPAMTGCSSSAAGAAGAVPTPSSGDQDKFLAGDGTWKAGGLPMVILSYGTSTWNDFISAYNNNVIVYCRASSNSNPASGSQTRMAFMAYVNDSSSPTNVEFQYYRSMNAHSSTAMGDEVYVYKLTNANGGTWSVTVRNASIKEIKMATGSAGSVSWNGDVVTLDSGLPAVTASDNGKILKVVNGAWAVVDP